MMGLRHAIFFASQPENRYRPVGDGVTAKVRPGKAIEETSAEKSGG